MGSWSSFLLKGRKVGTYSNATADLTRETSTSIAQTASDAAAVRQVICKRRRFESSSVPRSVNPSDSHQLGTHGARATEKTDARRPETPSACRSMARQEQPKYERTLYASASQKAGAFPMRAGRKRTSGTVSTSNRQKAIPTSLGRTRVGRDRATAVGSTLVVAFLSTRNFVSAAIDERHGDNDGAV